MWRLGQQPHTAHTCLHCPPPCASFSLEYVAPRLVLAATTRDLATHNRSTDGPAAMQVTISPGLAYSQADTHQEICEAPCEILLSH